MADGLGRDIRFYRLRSIGNAARAQLDTLDGVAGVQGWMAGNNAGDALMTSLPAHFDQRALDAIGHHILQLGQSAMGESTPTQMEIDFSQSHLLARTFGNGWLIVLCQPRADLAMVRVALSVAVASLTDDRALQSASKAPGRNARQAG